MESGLLGGDKDCRCGLVSAGRHGYGGPAKEQMRSRVVTRGDENGSEKRGELAAL